MRKAPASHHLAVLLYYLGLNGNGASMPMIGTFFGISPGTVRQYIARSIPAILSMRKDVIKWPSVTERKEIANRISRWGLFPQCWVC